MTKHSGAIAFSSSHSPRQILPRAKTNEEADSSKRAPHLSLTINMVLFLYLQGKCLTGLHCLAKNLAASAAGRFYYTYNLPSVYTLQKARQATMRSCQFSGTKRLWFINTAVLSRQTNQVQDTGKIRFTFLL